MCTVNPYFWSHFYELTEQISAEKPSLISFCLTAGHSPFYSEHAALNEQSDESTEIKLSPWIIFEVPRLTETQSEYNDLSPELRKNYSLVTPESERLVLFRFWKLRSNFNQREKWSTWKSDPWLSILNGCSLLSEAHSTRALKDKV